MMLLSNTSGRDSFKLTSHFCPSLFRWPRIPYLYGRFINVLTLLLWFTNQFKLLMWFWLNRVAFCLLGWHYLDVFNDVLSEFSVDCCEPHWVLQKKDGIKYIILFYDNWIWQEMLKNNNFHRIFHVQSAGQIVSCLPLMRNLCMGSQQLPICG